MAINSNPGQTSTGGPSQLSRPNQPESVSEVRNGPGTAGLTVVCRSDHSMKLSRGFTAFASKVARAAGRPSTVVLCLIVVSAWGISGPFFGFSDTWQLVINSISSMVTLVMAFLIQNTQNRDGAAIQAKLDEIIRSSAAHNRYIGIEQLTEEELDDLRERCARRARGELDPEEIAVEVADVKAERAVEQAA